MENIINRCVQFEKKYKTILKPKIISYSKNSKVSYYDNYDINLTIKINSDKAYIFKMCYANNIASFYLYYCNKLSYTSIYRELYHHFKIPYRYEKLNKLPKNDLNPLICLNIPVDIMPNILKYYSTINYYRTVLFKKLRDRQSDIEIIGNYTQIRFYGKRLMASEDTSYIYFGLIKICNKTGNTIVKHVHKYNYSFH